VAELQGGGGTGGWQSDKYREGGGRVTRGRVIGRVRLNLDKRHGREVRRTGTGGPEDRDGRTWTGGPGREDRDWRTGKGGSGGGSRNTE